jgi:hypothetical protein
MNTPLRDNQTMRTAIATSRVLPARQVRWTRLGAGMGYTNSEAKRATVRAAIEAMNWVEPEQLRDLLGAPIIRFYVTGLFYGRSWALHQAAVTPLPDGVAPDPYRCGRLIGLQAVSGDRYVLLDLGYEAIDLFHDRPATEQVMPR